MMFHFHPLISSELGTEPLHAQKRQKKPWIKIVSGIVLCQLVLCSAQQTFALTARIESGSSVHSKAFFLQQRKISGVVKGVNGEPFAGITITVKNNSRSVLSDNRGSYSIEASPDDILVFSYIGMNTQEIAV